MKNLFALIVCVFLCLSQSRGQLTPPGNNDIPDEKAMHTVDSLNELGFATKKFNLNKSLGILISASLLATENKYQKGLATNLLYEAGIYQQGGFDKKALFGYYQSLEISKAINDTFNIARATQQIATILQGSGKIKEAENLFNQAMKYYKKLRKDDEVVNTKNSIGSIYLDKKDYGHAAQTFTEALRGSKEISYKYGEKKSFYNLGLVNRKSGNTEIAKQFFDSSLHLDNQLHDQYGMALTSIALAEISNDQARYDDAITYSLDAFSSADSIKALQLVTRAIDNILIAYKKENDLKKVVEWQAKLISTLKELAEKEKLYAVNFIDILKDQQDKQLKIQESTTEENTKSQRQNIILVIVTIALITLSILAYLWYKNSKRAELYSLELAEKNLLIEKSSLSLDQLNKTMSKQNYRLEESNVMKDKLLSIISHDLRHPLVNTKGILELVNLNLVNPEETKQLLGQLESQYLRSLTLLDNLLFWIRGQMKGEMIDKVRINLNQLMEDLIEDHKIPLQNKRIITRNEVQTNLSVLGDKEMLKIIFRNLLSNAIKFTPQEGEIRVFSSNENGPAIHIKDSGVGMDTETLNKVNAKQYFTTRGTGNEAGSGFGLMLCHDLIEKHSGALSVKSEPGRGSTFSVQLPANPLEVKKPEIVTT